MKKIYTFLGRIVLPVLMLLGLEGCNKLVEVESPAYAIDSEILFSTQDGYEGAIRGIYQNMLFTNLSLTSGGLSLYMALAADDLVPRSTSVNYQAFYQNSLLSDNSVVSGFWSLAYDGIYRANILLENLESNSVLDRETTADFTGQALFTRAFYYFYLLQLFGDVPLVLDTDYRKNAVMPRTAYETVAAQIRSDLSDAALLIGRHTRADKAMPDYFAVQILRARTELLLGAYGAAAAACDTVISAGGFVLEDMDTAFKTGSRESIWQLTNEYRNVAEARSFVPSSSSSTPLFYLSESLLSIFGPEDLRLSKWVGRNVIGSVTYCYPYKYQNRSTTTPVTEYYVVFRLAEAYLMRAEARNGLQDTDGALEDLNAVRMRSGLSALDDGLSGGVMAYIEAEKRREFFAEWGHRWFDLKRWGKLQTVLSAVKPTWSAHAELMPVPYDQIQRNVFLEQNPGYGD
ncbi:RagB/SusD family nutrient uptake outer membrane protein [Sphingobacterium sp. LRF_L2]|uniref:RagB/SusD family nutrient uptake outer membrane protein n=1 Tax=Sphingobacterium sp. LRF_L2 TaxID=3369421 RepID=UPI003F5F05AF